MLLKAKDIPNSAGLAGDLSISGKVIRVFDRKAGHSEKGDWSFQNFIVQDDTGDMTVCLKGRDDTIKTSDVDKTITISSRETSKGIFGVKVEKEDYKAEDGTPKTSIKVIVTPSASIVMEGIANKASAEPAKETQAAPPQTVDLKSLREQSIEICFNKWKQLVGLDTMPIDNPMYFTLLNSIIATAGKNADTHFICKTGRNGKT